MVMSIFAATRAKWHRQVHSKIEGIKLAVERSPVSQQRPVILAWRVIQEMAKDDATLLAAGIAYYFFFSLFPLLLGLLAITGMVFKSEALQQDFLDFITKNLPGAAGFVERNVKDIVRFRGVLGVGAIVGLFWSASAVFGAISKAVNRAWNIQQDRPFYVAKPRHLGMALVVLVLFLISTVITTVIRALAHQELVLPGLAAFLELSVGQLSLRTVSWIITFGIFLLIYRFVPNCKTYWRYVWPGAVIAAVLFELGKSGFIWYLEKFANYTQVYGSLTSIIVLLLWAYISSLILILGAQVSSETEKLYHKNGSQDHQKGD
jgi:membrane protein